MFFILFLILFYFLFFSCLINVFPLFFPFLPFCFNVVSVGLQVLQSISQAVWGRKGFKMSSYSPHHTHHYLQMLFTAYCKGPIRWLVLHFLCVLLTCASYVCLYVMTFRSYTVCFSVSPLIVTNMIS